MPDEIGTVTLTAGRLLSDQANILSYRPVPLVQRGSLVATGSPNFTGPGPNATQMHALPGSGITPFNYTGNQAGFNDWFNATQNNFYPNDRVTIFSLVPT